MLFLSPWSLCLLLFAKMRNACVAPPFSMWVWLADRAAAAAAAACSVNVYGYINMLHVAENKQFGFMRMRICFVDRWLLCMHVVCIFKCQSAHALVHTQTQ